MPDIPDLTAPLIYCCTFWCFVISLIAFPTVATTGNVFSGTTELQFSDAKDTEWSGNSLPCGVSITITDGATFTEESPSACE